jgi:hypothetical protein
VFVEPEGVDDPAVRVAAALAYAGPGAARSHVTCLAVWRLLDPVPTVHISVPRSRGLRSRNGLVVHRRVAALDVVIRDGLPTLRLEQCLIDSWGLLDEAQRRGPVIESVRRRLTTAQRVGALVSASSNLPGRAMLLHLLDLLGSGCHSELEIWGFRRSSMIHGCRRRRRSYASV